MFFCDKEETKESLTQAQTLGLDKRVRDAATQLQDEKILAKLSAGDMIAVEAVYHKTCLAALYNRIKHITTTCPEEKSELSKCLSSRNPRLYKRHTSIFRDNTSI